MPPASNMFLFKMFIYCKFYVNFYFLFNLISTWWKHIFVNLNFIQVNLGFLFSLQLICRIIYLESHFSKLYFLWNLCGIPSVFSHNLHTFPHWTETAWQLVELLNLNYICHNQKFIQDDLVETMTLYMERFRDYEVFLQYLLVWYCC